MTASTGERLQGWLLAGFLKVTGALPLDAVSAVGGAIARTIGPRLAVSRRAARNLALALPGLSDAERRRIIRSVWNNLGRVVAEYAHVPRIRCFGPDSRVEIVGTEHVDAARASGKPMIFFSGHLGNWEIGVTTTVQYGIDVAQIYRAANNAAVEAVMFRLRQSYGAEPISKGAAGARRIISALRGGRALVMLVDQKMNDGIPVPFFGRDAMTAPAIAELALRYDCSLLPAHVERLRGAHFRVTIEQPLELPRSGDRQADIRETMVRVNRLLEGWIRAAPEQWFWLHRRWPNS